MWFVKITADILGTLAAMALAPFVCAFANKYTGRLPSSFWWMETPDNKLPGDLKEPTVLSVYNRFGFYLTSVYWLGWRNKAYGLSSRLRYIPKPGERVTYRGNPNVSDDTRERGWCLFRLGSAWEFYGVWGDKFGVRVRLGYKLQPYYQSTDWSNPIWGSPVIHVSLRKLA